jgi:WD40 repeat protein
VWDLKTGEITNRLQDRTLPLAYSPDGQHLLTGTAWWNVGRGPFVLNPLEPGGGPDRFSLRGLRGAPDELDAGAWSIDGSRLASANPRKLIMWDARTGEELFRVFPPAGQFTTVSFVPGSRLATGMRDGTVIVWKLSHLAADPIFTLAGHDARIEEISSTPDGTRLSTSSSDGRIKVWDITPEGSREWLTVSRSDKAHSYYYLVPVDLSPDGRLLAVGGWDGHVLVYDAQTGRIVQELYGHGAEVTAAEFDPSGSRLATGTPHGDVHVWDAVSGMEISSLQFGEGHEVLDVAFSPEGDKVATARYADPPQVQLWDPASGQHRRDFFPGNPTDDWWSRSIAFNPDGKLLAGESWS